MPFCSLRLLPPLQFFDFISRQSWATSAQLTPLFPLFSIIFILNKRYSAIRSINEERIQTICAGYIYHYFLTIIFGISFSIRIDANSALEILSVISQVSATLFGIITALTFILFQILSSRLRELPEKEEHWKRFKRLTPELVLMISFAALCVYSWSVMIFIKANHDFSIVPIVIAIIWMVINLFLTIVIVHATYVFTLPARKIKNLCALSLGFPSFNRKFS